MGGRYGGGIPGRGADGRTGWAGSGRGPPRFAPGRGGIPPPAGRCGARAAAPGAGRPTAGLLRLPVGACETAGVGGVGGRTRTGRRGGAGGACPVFGSSTRRRIVGGTTRPVGGGIVGRGTGGTTAPAEAGAEDVDSARAGSGDSIVGSSVTTVIGGAESGGAAGSTTGSGCCATGCGGSASAGGGATGAGTSTGSAAAGGATTASGGGAAGFADFTRRGGGSEGAAGFGGSALPAGFLPLAAAGVSANEALEGTVKLRWRARRETNSRATTSSIVLDALLTSIP